MASPNKGIKFSGGDALTLKENGVLYVIHQAFMANELFGGYGAYEISQAEKGSSGLSFGPVQYDLAPGNAGQNTPARQLFESIVLNAVDDKGKRIIDDVMFEKIQKNLYKPTNSMSKDEKTILAEAMPYMNKALSSEVGQKLINDVYPLVLDKKIESVQKIIGRVTNEANKKFLENDVAAQAVIADHLNQYGESSFSEEKKLMALLNQTKADGAVSQGYTVKGDVITTDDIRDFKLTFKFAKGNEHGVTNRHNVVVNIAENTKENINICSAVIAINKRKVAELKTEKTDLTADINVVKSQKKTILELGEHLKSHSFDNLKDVQKLDALAKTAGIELVTPAEAILADKEKINLTNKADITALQNVLFERGLITSPSRGIFGAQTKNALIKEFDLPQNHTFGNELAAEHLEKLNAKTVEAIQAKIDLVLPKLQKNQSTMENKMIEINKAIAALEAERIALNDPTIENYLEAQHAAKVAEAAEVEIENPQTQQALRVADVESPDLAQLQDDLVLKEMFIAELEQRIANLTALTAQVSDQNLENLEKPDLKIDLLEVENKEILLTMTESGMSFNINGKDHDASYFNQHQVGITETQSTYRNENNTLLAKYEYESDQFSIFHKNPYTVDKIAVISDFSQQNTINLVSFDAVKTQSLEKQKSLGKEC